MEYKLFVYDHKHAQSVLHSYVKGWKPMMLSGVSKEASVYPMPWKSYISYSRRFKAIGSYGTSIEPESHYFRFL